MMNRSIAVIALVLALCGVVAGQSRTANRVQDTPFSALENGNPPNDSIRYCINCIANATTGVCEAGGVLGVGMLAVKMDGLWKCSTLMPPGAGGGASDFSDLTGTATDAQIPNDITINSAALAALASAGDSATGFFPTGTLEAARGGTGLGAPGDDQVAIGNGTGFSYATLPSCSNATNDKLLYNTSTNTFTCGSDQTTGGGSGITTLNTLVATTQTFSKTDDTNVTLTLTPSGSDHNFALGWTGTLADARVADNITLTDITQITNRAISNTTGDLAASRVDDGGVAATQALFSGAGSSAGFRAIADADIPNTITIDTANSGDSATAFFSTGTLEVGIGGTGATSLTGLLQGNGTSAFTAITNSSTVGQVLRVTGASTYAWGAVNLADTDAVTGILPAANILATVTNSRCLRVNGSGVIEVHSADCGSGGGTPGGSDTQVQYNDGGAFGGDTGLTWNETTNTLTTEVLVTSGSGTAGYLQVTEGTVPAAVADTIIITAPTAAPGLVYILPSDTPTTGDQLTATISGTEVTLSWDAAGSGTGITSLESQTGATQTFTDDTNVTIVSGSNAHVITWAGQLAVSRGGTGASTLTGLLQGNGTSAVTAITNSTTVGQVLRVTGSNAYGWGALDLADADAVTGLLPDGNIAAAIARDSEINVQGTANEITSSGSGVAPTLSLASSMDLGGKIVELPNGTSPTGTDCDNAAEAGRIFIDTNATTGQQVYVCEGTAGWVLQGDGGGGGGANTSLNNLASVAINTTLVSDTDNTDDLGTSSIGWKDLHMDGDIVGADSADFNSLIARAGTIYLNSGATVIIARGTGSPEGVLTAGIGSLFLRSDGGTDTALYRKESGTGNTGWVATTAGGGGGANTALSNLASVAINTTLLSDTDNTDDLGTGAKRWQDLYIAGSLKDAADNEVLTIASVGSAVNEFTITNAATGNPPKLQGTGSDSNIDVTIAPKGTGSLLIVPTTAGTGVLGLIDTNQSHYLNITPGSNITADRTFTITTGDAARTLDMGGNITTAADFITSGANSLTLTTTGSTNVTLPTSGTLATLTSTATFDYSGAIFELPNGTAPTGTDCDAAGEAGRVFIDTNATSGQQIYVCEGTGGWILQGDGGGGGGANTALSNLASVAINTTLVSDTDNTDDLGTSSIRWKNLHLAGFIGDGNGNELLKFTQTASAVNEFTITNAATATNPQLSATGETNVGLDFLVKGTGVYRFLATASGPSEVRVFEDTDNGTNYVALKTASALGGDTTLTLPSVTGTLAVTADAAQNISGNDFFFQTGTLEDGELWLNAAATAKLKWASGSPEGSVSATVGSLFLRNDGGAGTTLYAKESGSGNTGWVAYAAPVAASETVAGDIEIATTAEINTGTDAGRAMAPDQFAASNFGTRIAPIVVFDSLVDTAVGDGRYYFPIPAELNGMILVGVTAQVTTVGTTNTLNVDLARCAVVATGSTCSGTVVDMLSTNLTIDSNENKSSTAAAAAVIDTANDDVATDQAIRIDIDAVHTTPAKGLVVTLTFRLP